MRIRHFFAGLPVMILALTLFGCSASEDKTVKAEGYETQISVKRDGSVICTLEDDFGEDYYSEESLEGFVESEISDYCKAAGEGAVSLKNMKIKDGTATLELVYKTGNDYADFNKVIFFSGTVGEAEDDRYDLEVVFTDTEHKGETIGREELLDRSSYRLIITEEKLLLNTPGKILYVSGGAEKTASKKASTSGDEISYIIYK